MSDVDPDRVAILQGICGSYRHIADHDRTVRFDHFQLADALVIIAENFQQDVAARSGRQQNVVGLQSARIVRNQIFRFRGLELKPATERACPPAQIAQIHFAVVVEKNFVVERRFHLRAGFEFHAIEHRIDVAQRCHPHFQSERDLKRAFASPRALETDFVRVFIDPNENLRNGNVFLGVEILGQLLIGQHVVAHQDSLPRINSAESAAHQRPAAHGNILAAVILEQDQVAIAKRHQPIALRQIFHPHVRFSVARKRERFQRRRAALINRRVGIFGRVQLVNDVDRLRRHAELRHKRIKRDHLFLFQPGLRNEIVKLDAEHDFALGRQLHAQLLRHRRQILLLVKRLPEKLAELGINGFGIIVPQKSKTRVNFFFQQDAVGFGKTRQHLDQHRQQVRTFRNAARLAQRAPHQAPALPPHAIRERRYLLHRAIQFFRDR